MTFSFRHSPGLQWHADMPLLPRYLFLPWRGRRVMSYLLWVSELHEELGALCQAEFSGLRPLVPLLELPLDRLLLSVVLHLTTLSRLAKLLLNDWCSNFRSEQHRL